MWALGDYAAVAPLLEPCADQLAELCQIRPGDEVLDVAAGNGNFALAAAARGGVVTASDLTPQMVELGRRRTLAAGREISWFESDAEELDFADGSFDIVASVFGAMFAPRPERVAAEMFRVCRPGGLVAMANYNWDGFLGEMVKLLADYSTPLPFELPSPFEWGDPAVVDRRLGGFASHLETQPDTLAMHFGGVNEGLDFWERTNPPTIALRATVPPERYAEFVRDARDLMTRLNVATDGSLTLDSSYLRVLARN